MTNIKSANMTNIRSANMTNYSTHSALTYRPVLHALHLRVTQAKLRDRQMPVYVVLGDGGQLLSIVTGGLQQGSEAAERVLKAVPNAEQGEVSASGDRLEQVHPRAVAYVYRILA
jgi:hypothetical protein